MGRTIHVTVESDGRVAIPGTQPGETLAIQIEQQPETPERLTLATAQTEDERKAVIAGIRQAARRFRAQLSDEEIQAMLNHGDLLYDEDGLPK